MARERMALQQQQFQETLRRNSIATIQSREQALAIGTRGGINPTQMAALQPHLATYTRRPTFQSRIGLVDSAERAIGSAIHPRW